MSVALLPVEDRREKVHRALHVGDDPPGAPRLLAALGDPAFREQDQRELEVFPRPFVAATASSISSRTVGGGSWSVWFMAVGLGCAESCQVDLDFFISIPFCVISA